VLLVSVIKPLIGIELAPDLHIAVVKRDDRILDAVDDKWWSADWQIIIENIHESCAGKVNRRHEGILCEAAIGYLTVSKLAAKDIREVEVAPVELTGCENNSGEKSLTEVTVHENGVF
jgi:hypothetical protein